MDQFLDSNIFKFITSIASLILVIGLHEYAHAYTANLFGDPTPKFQGRLTPNPLKHIDPMGLLMIFLIGFGWGKPVEITSYYFKNPKQHEAIVAIAGPMMNFLIAVICATIIKYAGNTLPASLVYIIDTILIISVTLLAFNILPFPPLDGSKFLQLLLPQNLQKPYANYLANGTMYFIALLLIDNLILSRYLNFSIISTAIQTISKFIYTIIFFST